MSYFLPLVIQVVSLVVLATFFAFCVVEDQLRMRKRRAIWEGTDAQSRSARRDSWVRRRLLASHGLQQLTREAVVDANERQANRELWSVDPAFAASLGIECPPMDTGHLRRSAEAMRPGGVIVLEAGVMLTSVDVARLRDEWQQGGKLVEP